MTEWVTLHDGTEIDLFNPDLTGVAVETLAIQMARTFRFNGATKRPYCVLEHSIRGARAALDPKQFPGIGAFARAAARTFLLHDAHEAVIGDIASPVARVIGYDAIATLKARVDIAMHRRFDFFPTGTAREIAGKLDQVMFQREWLDLMPTPLHRSAPGPGNDGPVRDYIGQYNIHPEEIDPYVRPNPQMLIGEFCHLLRVTQ